MNSQIISRRLEMAFNEQWQHVMDWALRIGTPVVLGVAGWIGTQVTDDLNHLQRGVTENAAQLREMKAVEFDVADAIETEKRHALQLRELQRVIQDMERRIPSRAEFEALNQTIRDLRDDVRRGNQ